MHHIVKSLLRHARRSMCASARAIHPKQGTESSTFGFPGRSSARAMSSEAEKASGNPDPCPVKSYNEWDPLEEVIVGTAYGYREPKLDVQRQAGTLPWTWDHLREIEGQPADKELLVKAEAEVDTMIKIFEAEGIVVKRPEEWDWNKYGMFSTPYFEEGGFKNCCPRDGILVVGDEMIETAMAMRSRLFEFYPYRKLLQDYWRKGATWTAAPRPTMHDDLYRKDFPLDDFDAQEVLLRQGQFSITEAEVVFEAADCIRFGRDIFVTITHTTNHAGVEWLRRYLAPKGYRVHKLLFLGKQNNHADATLMPLRKGVMAVSEHRPCIAINDKPCGWEYFEERGWKILKIPMSNYSKTLKDISSWLNINMLSIDGERIMCLSDEPVLRDILVKNGFTPIELPFRHCFYLGGAFHCWTLDVRRRGELEDYGLN